MMETESPNRTRNDGGAVKETLLSSTKIEPTERKPPIDRFFVVYIIFMLHGIGTLMPWNMFITANDYFVNYKLAAPSHGNETIAVKTTIYQDYFLGFLGFVSQVPNVILNGINVFCQIKGGSTGKRIVWSIMIVVVMFIVTVALAMIDSSQWPAAFFWITMVTVVIINMANGVYQNSVYGSCACLPMKYTNAVITGSNISGTITAVIAIISIASTPNPHTSAIYYFLAAIFVLLVAFDTYFVLDLLPFYRYYNNKSKTNQDGSDKEYSRPPYWEIFKQCWVHDISVFLVFFATLAVFPAIQANIKRSDPNFFISEQYYSPVTCFLLFNVFALTGNVISSFIKIPGPRWTWLPIVLRLLFIPFFMFCNFKPTSRQLPVLIANDYAYIVGGILLAVTSGYFSSLAMMFAPDSVKKPEYKGVAGMMAAFFLILGIFAGITFSIPVTMFIMNIGGSGQGTVEELAATIMTNSTDFPGS